MTETTLLREALALLRIAKRLRKSGMINFAKKVEMLADQFYPVLMPKDKERFEREELKND